jgi:hypothetical protein
MKYRTRIKRLREEVYYIGGSPIRKANKRQRRTVRRVKESTVRTIRN